MSSQREHTHLIACLLNDDAVLDGLIPVIEHGLDRSEFCLVNLQSKANMLWGVCCLVHEGHARTERWVRGAGCRVRG